MVHNMQNGANKVEAGVRVAGEVDFERSKAQVETLKVIACPICRAVYVPFLREGKGLQDSAALLETSFLGVCRFCFCCQKPACPQCWNREHNICAACSREARLPFHVALPSFEGLVFSPLLSLQKEPALNVSFICRRNGRFSRLEAGSPGTSLSAPLSGEPDSPAREYSYPAWLQDVMKQKTGPQLLDTHARLTGGWQDGELREAERTPEHSLHKKLEFVQTTADLCPGEEPIKRDDYVAFTDTSTVEEVCIDEPLPLVERIENVLIVLISLVLIALVMMIVLAMNSADMNALFLRVFHVDIRAEIAYLLELI